MNPPTLVERIIEGLLRVPVFLKVIGIALGLTLLLGGTMFWQVHDSWHRALLGGSWNAVSVILSGALGEFSAGQGWNL